MDELQQQYLEAMGIQRWVSREAVESEILVEVPVAKAEPEVPPPAPPETPASETVDDDAASLDWVELQARVAACQACPELVANRSQTVFGVGNPEAGLLVIGEAPGADEDRQGEPFVGRAGKLLNNMLLAIGLKREAVYIANILKCRPPNNRDPGLAEAASCEPFLKRQIELIQPKIILVVGRIAAQNLLKTDTAIGKMRGNAYHYGDTKIPVVVTYHPAYLLRSPSEKRKSWEDLKRALSLASVSG